MTTALIYLTGILVTAFIAYLLVEVVLDRTPKGVLSDAYRHNDTRQNSRLQNALSPLGVPVQKYAPPALLRKIQADLYWAQALGRWVDWNAVQFVALQVASALGGLLLGMFLTQDPLMTLVAGYIGWSYPGMSVNGVARRTRRLFVSQLPEFVQLVSAQMAAGVSMEEAIQRTAKAPGLVGQVTYRATDRAGNPVLASMALKVDTLAPETWVEALAPQLNGTVTISGRSADTLSGLAAVAYSLDGGVTWKSLERGSWSFTWNTSTVGDGPHEIKVRASDNVGNTATQTITALVANQAPKVSIQDAWDYADAGALLVAMRNNVAIRSVTVTVSCAPAHPDALYQLEPGELASTFHWEMRCGDGAYASQRTEYPVTLKACDIFGRCSVAEGRILALFRMTPTPTPSPTATATATASPSPTATRAASPTPTALVTPTPEQRPEPPMAETKPFAWWLLLSLPGLLLVFGLNVVTDRRPAAIRRLATRLFDPDHGH